MQDAVSGAAGRNYGLQMAAYVIASLNLRRTNETSNEVVWKSRPAIVKSCGRKTSSYGVTVGALERIEFVLAAFTMSGRVEIWELTVDEFEKGMCDSRSKSANGSVKQVSRGFTRKRGEKVTEIAVPVFDLS